jgi:hypothetical protein
MQRVQLWVLQVWLGRVFGFDEMAVTFCIL